MVEIVFKRAAIDELYTAQLSVSNPRIRKKLMAVYLKTQGLEHCRICSICRITAPTLIAYLKEYLEGGIEKLAEIRHEGHPSMLRSYAEEIKKLFTQDPPATLKEARAKIANLTGLERSLPQIWAFMKKLGLSTRKVGGVPGKADTEAQAIFKKKNLNHALRKPKQESV